MDRLSWLNKLTPAQTAQAMFWINLLPAAAAATLICFYFDDRIRADFGTLVGVAILFFGLVAQVSYFLQFNFSRYANNKSLWMFSMVYCSCCSIAFLTIAAMSRIWGLLYLVIYPNFFFYLSYLSYQKLPVRSKSSS